MVFESIVADLLNKHLGKYVENLDASQLKIGIWGGNVVLKNLELKDTALDDLDLPIKVVKGFLGKLTLSIPWKNLYTEPTIVNLENLHILAKPNFDIKYDEEKEEKSKYEQKKKEVENIEEARRNEELRRIGSKDKLEDQDSFTEKLATSIIKNLQITIQSIHVRYEDSISDPVSPFSIGVTLENLSAETTDDTFQPHVIKDEVTIIHKLIRLDNLAVYWNPGESFKEMSTEVWLEFSKERIACYKNMPLSNDLSMNYIIQPIVAYKKMKINTKPGLDNSIPKFFSSLVLQEFGILLLRSQYHGLVKLIDSIEKMQRNQPYRKYRPDVSVDEDPKRWWKYCITSILEVDVQRRAHMWSWKNIRNHRILCRHYKESYKKKLMAKNPSIELLSQLEEMEQELNVVSITIFRQFAENEVAREKKLKKSTSKSKGGYFSFFYSKKDDKKSPVSRIEDILSSEKEKEKEMQKLYQAIGYTENEVITPFPAEYVALVFNFSLNKIQIKVQDDIDVGRTAAVDISCFTLDGLNAEVLQRPSSKGLRASLKIDELKLWGTLSEKQVPVLIKSSKRDPTDTLPLVDLCFEKNPLSKLDVDQSIEATCQPLEIVYDAKTIASLMLFFEPPEEIVLKDLQEKAYITFEDFKVSSTAGLMYAMEQRNVLDVNIHLNASYLIIPETGSYFSCTDMIVIDFGSLVLRSDPNQVRILNLKEVEDTNEIQENAYDRFLLNLTALQLLLCKEGEDLRHIRSLQNSPSHILHPISFVGQVAKAIIPKDPRLKQFCITGELPSLEVNVSDSKLSRIVKLFDSLPLPTEKKISSVADTKVSSALHVNYSNLIIPEDEEIVTTMIDEISEQKREDGYSSEAINQVTVEMQFGIKRLKLYVALIDNELLQEKDSVSLVIDDIFTEVKVRRWDMFLNARIGQLNLYKITHGDSGEPRKLLSTEKDTKILNITYKQCNFMDVVNLGGNYFNSSEFQLRTLHYRDEFEYVEKHLEIEVAMLFIKLHQEALLGVISMIDKVLEPFVPTEKPATAATVKRSMSTLSDRFSLIDQNEKKRMQKKKSSNDGLKELKEKVGLVDRMELKIIATMAGAKVHVCSAKVDLAEATVSGLSAQVMKYDKRLEVKAKMTHLHLHDNTENTKFPDIISMESDQVFEIEVTIFEDGTKAERSLNMSDVDTMIKLNFGQMKAVFLNRFICDMISFINNFEEAKNAILEAGKAAKEKAAAVVNELGKHSYRHKLDVILHAPMIIIPVDSKSVLALFVYLGKIYFYNTFKIKNTDVAENIVITDNMVIRLAELKISKALFNSNNQVIRQRSFIEPITLKLDVVRNLTFGNHSIPDLSIQGSSEAITLYLSEEDINIIMIVLQGNLAEGKILKNKDNRLKGSYKYTGAPLEPERCTLNVPDDSEEKSIFVVGESDSNTDIQTYFNFDLDKILLKVYSKPVDITFEDEFLERNEESFLSEFMVGHLDASGKMYSNGEVNFNIMLETLILDDKRINSKGNLTRMVDYCPEPLLETMNKMEDIKTKGMLELLYNQSPTSDKSINIQLSNLLCILDMEFIMLLVNTLLAAIPDGNLDHVDRSLNVESTSSGIDLSGSEDSDSDFGKGKEDIVPHSDIKLTFDLQNPQIVLLADARDAKSNALFLTTKISFKYFNLHNVQKILTDVSNTSIVSTAFSKDYRTDISTVLALDSINMLSSAPADGKPHIHISTSSIEINISPQTLHTLTASIQLATCQMDSEEKEQGFDNIWDLRSITDNKKWYCNIPPQNSLSAGSFVLARNKENIYKTGFLSKKDTHFTVFFYPEGTISHSVLDSTSVVIDLIPNEQSIVVGASVIATHPEDGYKTGKVIKVRKAALKTSNQRNVAESGWEVIKEDKSDNYQVHFYHDDSESYVSSMQLRLLPSHTKGVIPGIGAGVYARFKDGSYYKGMVKSIQEYKVKVFFDEIGGKIVHDRDDNAAVILNIIPEERQIKKLFKVIAQRAGDSKGLHPGKVMNILGNPGYYSYFIKFEDGSTNQVKISKLRLMPKAPYDVLPEIGSYVYSRIGHESPIYEKGIVVERNNHRILVNHVNSRKLSHDIKNIGYVVRNIVPLNSSLMVDQDVIAQIDSDDQSMHMGIIKEITSTGKFKKYLVEFADKDKIPTKLTAGRIRILSTYGNDPVDNVQDVPQIRKEQLVLEIEKVCLNIQGYLGGVLTSVLHFDMKLNADMYEWSKKMKGHANISMHSNYYNDLVAEWEPFIEPVTVDNIVRNWQLTIDYLTEDADIQNNKSDDVALLQTPMSTLSIKSYDNLEITLTKESIFLLQELGKSFSAAGENIKPEIGTQINVDTSYPYVVHNKLGIKLTVRLDELLQSVDGKKEVYLDALSSAGLQHADKHEYLYLSGSSKLHTISIQVNGYQEVKNITVKRHRTVIYNLVPINILAGEHYSVVIQITVRDGRRNISIRSPLQIKNHFPIPLNVCYFNKDEVNVDLITVQPDTKYAIPLALAYHTKFFIKPADFGYNLSTGALDWKTLSTNKQQDFVCLHSMGESEPFYIQAIIESDDYTSIHGLLSEVPHYTINCYPPIVLRNFLPYNIQYKSKDMVRMETLEGGNKCSLFTVNVEEKPVIELMLENYMECNWHGTIFITGTKKGKTSRITSFTLKNNANQKLDLGLFQLQEGTLKVTFYSPYWMMNKTGLDLVYQAVGNDSILDHPASILYPVMLHVKAKKKKARLSIRGNEWSDDFSLDTIGSSGSLKSAGVRGRIFEIGIGISLSNFALTKIVTFTPLRLLNNCTKFTISMAEANSETSEWHTVKPDESIPFWPKTVPPKNLYININGTDSVQFNPEYGKTLLLKFQNEIGGVCVTYYEKDTSSLLSFNSFFPGASPARIENRCKQISMITYKQTDFYKGHVLLYGQSVIYTWDDPTLPPELTFAVIEYQESETKIKLDKNDFGRMKVGSSIIYWVLFLDGIQRVLLFTDDFKAAYYASQENIMRPTQEISVNIDGIGLSLVNIEKRIEVAYLAIRKSHIVWEQMKKNRWKTFGSKMSEALEESYWDFRNGKSSKIKVLDMEVDYEKMFISKPEKIKIQRTFHSGIKFKYSLSPNHMSISGSISSLQVDTRIPGSTFLTVIHEVPPPKSVTSENAPMPFIEMSLITKLGEKNVVNEVNYFKILIQEIGIRIDTGFIYALIELFTNEEIQGAENDRYKADISFALQRIDSSAEIQATKQMKRYVFNHFHLSPLKIRVSFSMGGYDNDDDDDEGSSVKEDILSMLLQSVGVAFTEIQDVEFKLAYYEIESTLLSTSQLADAITKHYYSQAFKQLYVLVLGLDVLGNPYELVTGVGTGAKNLFYEPYQGLIQGPEEFAEGIAYGVKSLLGGTVGGVSGAVSKITGTVGKGIAALTFDDEYQQKRRQTMSRKPTNVGEGLTKGGKGLLKGFLSGVTGVVTKPIEGAKEDGVGGFFKGIGKGLIGVVARPAGGVIDMASSTLEGIKSTTTGAQIITPIRIVRAFHADKVLQPFNKYEAEGNQMLINADKGRYAKTDAYMMHISQVDGKNYLMLTDKNIIYIKRNEILNGWESSWHLSFHHIKGEPILNESTITFNLQVVESHMKFKKPVTSRKADLQSVAAAKWFLSKLEDMKLL